MTKINYPETWELVQIGDITASISKTDPKQSPKEYFTYLDISGIDNAENKIVDHKTYLGKDAPSRARQIVKSNDILFSTVRTYLKNIAMVPSKFDGQIASTGFSILRAKTGLESQFLFFYTLTSRFLNPLGKLQRGSSYPAVRDSDVREQHIPLPPSSEQRRIIAKIEELFSELDAGIASLKKAQAQLKTYRQALLKHAFEGKLTADWRAANADKLEPADVLLERIKAEREARQAEAMLAWETEVAAWEAAGKPGKKPRKPRPMKELPPLTEEETAELPELPAGWAYVKIQYFLTLDKKPMTTGPFGTALKKNEHQSAGLPVLGIENIGNGKFIPRNKIFITKEKGKELQSFRVENGDVIISRSGTVGEICKVPEGLGEVFISTNLIRIGLNKNAMIEDFFVYLFQGGGSVMQQVKNLCKGSSRDFLNQTILSSIIFPLPNLKEQAQIIQELDSKLSIVEQFDKVIQDAVSQSESLRQSILKQAFSGQLVPQNPNDEPASVLLERIKAEKAAT